MSRSGKTQAGRNLPEHLVEEIVARIPFPGILKARQLSKEWKLKFPSVARESFHSWPHYLARVTGYDVLLYDHDAVGARGCVKRMPVGMSIYAEQKFSASHASCGSLLVAVRWYQLTIDGHMSMIQPEATVTNVFTRQSKRILCPITPPVSLSEILLVPVGTDHYDLIISYFRVYDSRSGAHITVFHSSTSTWETQCQHVGKVFHRSVYNDGIWYYKRPRVARGDRLIFARFQNGVETETTIPFQELEKLPFGLDFLVRCGSDIMVVVVDYRRSHLIVLQLDTKSSALVEVSRTPYRFEFWSSHYIDHTIDTVSIECIGSRNRIYLTSFKRGKLHHLYVYDVKTKTWSNKPIPLEFIMDLLFRAVWCPPYVLDLGLNPFVKP